MDTVRFRDTVGFTWQGKNLCLACTWLSVRELILREGWLEQGEAYYYDVHGLVGIMAARKRIPAYSRQEFRAYNTGLFEDVDDFPKAFKDAGEDERCMGEDCGESFTPAH